MATLNSSLPMGLTVAILMLAISSGLLFATNTTTSSSSITTPSNYTTIASNTTATNLVTTTIVVSGCPGCLPSQGFGVLSQYIGGMENFLGSLLSNFKRLFSVALTIGNSTTTSIITTQSTTKTSSSTTYNTISSSTTYYTSTYNSISSTSTYYTSTYNSISSSTIYSTTTYNSLSSTTTYYTSTYNSISSSTTYFTSTYNALSSSTTTTPSTYTTYTTTIFSCPGGSTYNSTTKTCQCPSGEYFNNNAICTSGTPSCSGGTYYNTTYNACICPKGEYYNNGICTYQSSTTTIPSNSITTSTVYTTTITYCPGGSSYNSTSKFCKCPSGQYFYPNGLCVSGAVSCPGGSGYNTTYNACVCPMGRYFNGTACTAPMKLIFPTNIVYPSNLPQTTNSIYSLPQNSIANISVSEGIRVSAIANSLYAANTISFRFGCLGCNTTGTATNPNSIIEGFIGNGSITKAAFIQAALASNVISANNLANLANTIAQNSVLFRQMINNYTPSGFRASYNYSTTTKQNSTTYTNRWLAVGNTTNIYVNVSALKAIASNAQNLQSLPLSDRAAAPFVNSAFNDTNIVNRTTSQQIYVKQAISGNKTVTSYVPTNVTTYKSKSATVVSITNVPSGFATYVNITKSSLPIKNMTFSTKVNFTASAISIKSYAANTTNTTITSLSKFKGNVTAYLSVNSTIKDSNLNSVNYTFNISAAYILKNHLDARNLSMYRYNATTNTWVKLVTVLVSSNATTYIYRARSPGMSLYLIYAPALNYSTANVEITVAPTNATNSTVSNQQTPFELSKSLQIVAAMLVVATVAVLIYLGRSKAEEKPKKPEKNQPIESF